MAQQIFDPIDFACPITLVSKLLLQRLLKEKLAWDHIVKVPRIFRNWLKELPTLTNIIIPRCIRSGHGVTQNCTLHTLYDASQRAYSAVVFLRIIREGKVVSYSIVDCPSKGSTTTEDYYP